MSLTTNFDVTPYFDDYNEDKNFHRVLFKAGYAVQARELTQLQTILQDQIARFGENVIKEGSIVKGGNFVEVNPLPYIKIEDSILPDGETTPLLNPDLTSFVGKYVKGVNTGIKAIIIEIANGTQTDLTETKTLFLKYLNNAQNPDGTNKSTLNPGESFEIYTDINLTTKEYTGTILGGSESVGNGYGVRCGNGIIFQKGHFTRFEDDLTIVSRYTTTPTDVVVGFRTYEDIVTADQDETLFDNASGFDNENAPGADRLRLQPSLVTLTIDEAKSDPNFFSIQEYQQGKVVRRRLTTQYNGIEKMVEQRTYEESGNYAVNDFKIKMEEHTSNNDLVSVNISPGIAYVEGKRVELVGNYNYDIPKSGETDIKEVVGQDVSTTYGHYVLTADNPTLIDFDAENLEKIYFHDSTGQAATANIRNITKDGNKYRIYFFNLQVENGKLFSDVTSVRSATPSVANATLDSSTIYDYNFRSLVFPIGKDFISTVESGSGASTYMFRGSQTILTNTAGQVTVTLGSAENFIYNDGTLTGDQVEEFVVINRSLNEPVVVSSIVQNSSQSVTIYGSNISSGQNIVVYYNTKLNNITLNSKELQSYQATIPLSTYPGTNQAWSLGVPDGWKLEWVKHDGTDVTDNFTLDSGQKDSYYGFAKIINKSSTTYSSGTLEVAFYSFTHTLEGSFFTVDSYPVGNISYTDPSTGLFKTFALEDIPVHKTESGRVQYLRDQIDCRPSATPVMSNVQQQIGYKSYTVPSEPTLAFDGSSMNIPAVNQYTEINYSYNIGRYDRLIIDERGEFEVLTGVASEDPYVPSEPKKGMTLAVLKLPPYPCIPMSVAKRAGKTDYGISIVPVKNKRYTMKDISKIESRIKTLEYFTSLSLLEKQTKDLIITDGQGTDRFKNGILVDNFQNLAIGNTTSPEFSAAVDPSFKELMPRFRSYPVSFKVLSGINIHDTGIAATLSKDDVVIIDQPYATNTKSCTTDYYKYEGAMIIYPEHDSVPDVTRAPDINIEIDLATPFIEFTELLSEFVPLQNVSQEVVASTVSRSGGFLGWGRTTTTSETVQVTTDTLQVSEGQTETQGLGDFVTDLQFEPYMRGRDIEVYITGLKPNTRMYFYFDGKSVDQYMTTGTVVTSNDGSTYVAKTGGAGADSIITSDEGKLAAVFELPSETFFVGDRLLECFDSPVYEDRLNSTTYASRNYSAFNFSIEKTGMTVSTRMPRMEIDTQITSFERTRRRGGSDPIAQTFIIDKDQSNDTSVMLTEVSLYFSRKSSSGNGVTLAIVETMNGYPTGKVIPFSQVHKTADEVAVSETSGNAETVFTFEAPVAITTGIEYALVIAPDANDPDYRVWISTTGLSDVDTDVAVTQDTNAGVLFTSTNAKAWTPYQNENLKFKISRANYTSTTGQLDLVTKDNEFFEISSVGGDFIIGEDVISILQTLGTSGVVSGGGLKITVNSWTNQPRVGEKVALSSSTFEPIIHTVVAVSSTEITLASPVVNMLTGITVSRVATGKVVYQTRTEPQRLVLENSNAEYITGTGPKVFIEGYQIMGLRSGTLATLDTIVNQKVSYMQPSIFRSNFTKTSTTAEIVLPALAARNIAFNTNNYMTDENLTIASRSNEVVTNNDSTTRNFKLRVNLSTINDVNSDLVATSPLIDYDISNMLVYEFKINNDDTNEKTFRGNATSKYISRTVELKDGLDAEDLKVFLTAYRPSSSEIGVYARFQSQFDNRPFNEIEWTKLEIKPETDLRSASSNRWDFVELEYSLPTAEPNPASGGGAWLDLTSNTIRYTDENGAEYSDYKLFAIKIVLLSPNIYAVPRLKDLRALALS